MECKEAAEEHILGITKLWMEFMYQINKAEPFDANNNNILEQMAVHFKEKIDDPNSLLLIAQEADHTIGYMLAGIDKDKEAPEKRAGYIYDIAVTNSHRGQGIGKKMLEYAKTWFGSRNIEKLEFSTVTRKALNESAWVNQPL